MVVGKDIVTNHSFSRISDFGVYFGDYSEEYEENYYYHKWI